eukprot:m.14833 g.14833  ORF g.14833 m.14833 type:complete len:309 (+) comp6443_c0_seq1:3653-4579(+)
MSRVSIPSWSGATFHLEGVDTSVAPAATVTTAATSSKSELAELLSTTSDAEGSVASSHHQSTSLRVPDASASPSTQMGDPARSANASHQASADNGFAPPDMSEPTMLLGLDGTSSIDSGDAAALMAAHSLELQALMTPMTTSASPSAVAASQFQARPGSAGQPVSTDATTQDFEDLAGNCQLKKQPNIVDFASHEEYQAAFRRWRAARAKNNVAVKKSREKARKRAKEAKKIALAARKEQVQLQTTATTLQRNLDLLVKAVQCPKSLSTVEQAWVTTVVHADNQAHLVASYTITPSGIGSATAPAANV